MGGEPKIPRGKSMMTPFKPAIKIKALRDGVQLPSFATSGSAGMDLHAAEEVELSGMGSEEVELSGMGWRNNGAYVPSRSLVPTGIAVEIPNGYHGEIRPRSGLAFKHGITVLNSPGTIDSDYRGEVFVLLINFGRYSYAIKPGDRIAQLVFTPNVGRDTTPIHPAVMIAQEAEGLSETERGDGGFGSTGA